jgi:hypothetical protein
VLVPGERSHSSAVAADRDGLALPAEVFDMLERLGSELGVPPPPP